MPKGEKSVSQVDKFREAARQHETDDSEEAFDRALKKIAKSSSATGKQKKPGDD